MITTKTSSPTVRRPAASISEDEFDALIREKTGSRPTTRRSTEAGVDDLVRELLAALKPSPPRKVTEISGAAPEPWLKVLVRARGPAAHRAASRRLAELLNSGGNIPSCMPKISALLASRKRVDRAAALKGAFEMDPQVKAELQEFLSKEQT